MRLAEYSDDELIEEIKHRGIRIAVKAKISQHKEELYQVIIGGVAFDL